MKLWLINITVKYSLENLFIQCWQYWIIEVLGCQHESIYSTFCKLNDIQIWLSIHAQRCVIHSDFAHIQFFFKTSYLNAYGFISDVGLSSTHRNLNKADTSINNSGNQLFTYKQQLLKRWATVSLAFPCNFNIDRKRN